MKRRLILAAAGAASLGLAACGSGGDGADEVAAGSNALVDGATINRADDASAMGADMAAPMSGGGTIPPNAQNGSGAAGGMTGTTGTTGAGGTGAGGTGGGTGGDTGSMTGTGIGESGQSGGTGTGTGSTSGTRTTPGGGT